MHLPPTLIRPHPTLTPTPTPTDPPHLLGPGKRKHVAGALLRLGRAHALQGERFGHRLARAPHRPARVDAQQDGAAVGGGADLAAVGVDLWQGGG